MNERCDCVQCRNHDAGHRGRMFTPRDFIDTFGVANAAVPLEVPAELVEFGIEVDAAQVRYDEAKRLFEDAMRHASAQKRGAGKVAAEQGVEIARELLADEGERLRAARTAYNTASTRINEKRRREEYQADLAAQAAAKEAARSARLAQVPRSPLAKIRAKASR